MDTAEKNQPKSTGLLMELTTELDATVDLNHTFVINYSTQALPAVENIHAPVYGAARNIELWTGAVDFIQGQNGDWNFYQNDQYLIAAVPSQTLRDRSIDDATEYAYREIFKLMNSTGFGYLIRTWNYIPDITESSKDNNNHYQLFCSGRARAYSSFNEKSVYPAATVVGTKQSSVNIYFIASKTPGFGVENPQQVSAYHYPIEYSKDPPLFSRAVIHRNDLQEIIFVSGTASITGHSTLFEGDVIKQLDVCLDNIQCLIDTAVKENLLNTINLAGMTQLKVYVKNADDFQQVQSRIENALGTVPTICYIQGDLCREDLLVEVEALSIQQNR